MTKRLKRISHPLLFPPPPRGRGRIKVGGIIIIKPLPNWLAIIFKLKTQRKPVINIPTQHRFAQNVL